MKKYIGDLDLEQLKKVLSSNQSLQYDVLNDMIETEHLYIEDYMYSIKDSLVNWSIGTCAHCSLTVNFNKMREFLEGTKEIQYSYGLLNSEELGVEKLIGKVDELYDMNMYSDEFYELENELFNKVQGLADQIAREFDRYFNGLYDSETQEGYFMEFYAENRLDEGCYINLNDNDYILHEDISYTKSYS